MNPRPMRKAGGSGKVYTEASSGSIPPSPRRTIRNHAETAQLPPPPRMYSAYNWIGPACIAEAVRFIDRYNAWVALWNRHELDQSLPIGPEPECGGEFHKWVRESALICRDRPGNPNSGLVMRLLGWSTWEPKARQHIRRRADIGTLVWAGWLP